MTMANKGCNRIANQTENEAKNEPENEPEIDLVNGLDLLSKGDEKNYYSDVQAPPGFKAWRCEVGSRLMIKQFLLEKLGIVDFSKILIALMQIFFSRCFAIITKL
jgi:hypothetical protein